MPILKFPTTRNLLACLIEGLILLSSAYCVKRQSVGGDFFHVVRFEELGGHFSMSVDPSVDVTISDVTMDFATG
jgi:serine phosphatase RsbU (regulator of sigma subunit)